MQVGIKLVFSFLPKIFNMNKHDNENTRYLRVAQNFENVVLNPM